jgi:dUTP pyrophosphatase
MWLTGMTKGKSMLKLNLRRTGSVPATLLPRRSTSCAAGYDIYSPVFGVIPSGQQSLIKLGFAWDPNNENFHSSFGGFFAKIFDRSGLAVKSRLSTLAGVIDTDYRDEWGLVITNNGDKPFEYDVEQRLAQFVLLPYLIADDLEGTTDVRSGGFGSTGR